MSKYITDETYKGLTPDEQAKYGDEVYGWRHHGNYEESDWHNEIPAEQRDYKSFKAYKSHHSKLNIETRSVHYLKPAEAQQSEGETAAFERYGSDIHSYGQQRDGFVEGYKARDKEITALQQEGERLKKRDELYKFIFDIDWMSTKEFCDRNQLPAPIPMPSDIDSANQFLRLDAIKWNQVVSKAKEIARANPLPEPPTK